MYMDDIKLFAKNETKLETLIHTVRIHSRDIGMEFGIEKCPMLVIKSGKRQLTGGMELPNQDKIKNARRKRDLQILGHLGGWHNQTSGIERQNWERISQEN